jgi:hypothetical protein
MTRAFSSRRRQEEQRRRQIPTALCNYENSLGEQLLDMVERFHSASTIREFVRAAESASVATDKLDVVRRWLAWTASWAERLDPLGELAEETRVVALDPERTTEEEFNWPDSEERASAGYIRRFEPRGVQRVLGQPAPCFGCLIPRCGAQSEAASRAEPDPRSPRFPECRGVHLRSKRVRPAPHVGDFQRFLS